MNQPLGTNAPSAPEQTLLEALMARVRKSPGEFRTTAAMAASAGLDEAGLEALFGRRAQKVPADFLVEARVEAACRTLLNHYGPTSAAAEVCGFPSQTIFQAQFHRLTGMTPGRYQALGREGDAFQLDLPADYRREDVLAYHGRDPLSLTEKVEGDTLLKATRLEGRDALLELAFKPRTVKVRVHTEARLDPFLMGSVHHRVVRMLGLATDPVGFEEGLLEPGFQALVAPRRGLRIPLTADVWEALVWAILGQQVNLAFAYTLRRKLTERCGGKGFGGLRAHPGALAVADLEPADLAPLQFSRSKAEYLIATAREVASGALKVEAMPAGAASTAESQLSARRGIGPWTTHYVMMRGCGFADCVPLGDAGLTAALQRHYGLDHRPDAKETAALMAKFAPHRSLATFHLWASLKGVPA